MICQELMNDKLSRVRPLFLTMKMKLLFWRKNVKKTNLMNGMRSSSLWCDLIIFILIVTLFLLNEFILFSAWRKLRYIIHQGTSKKEKWHRIQFNCNFLLIHSLLHDIFINLFILLDCSVMIQNVLKFATETLIVLLLKAI